MLTRRQVLADLVTAFQRDPPHIRVDMGGVLSDAMLPKVLAPLAALFALGHVHVSSYFLMPARGPLVVVKNGADGASCHEPAVTPRGRGALPGRRLACTTDADGCPQLAALNRTYLSMTDLVVRAVEEDPRHIRHAAMTDPATAAALPVDQIWQLCDDMVHAHADRLPPSLRGHSGSTVRGPVHG